jgi:hypothetical protein
VFNGLILTAPRQHWRAIPMANTMTPSGLYGYDAENRLVNLSGTATYTYDADGQRVAKPNVLYWAGPVDREGGRCAGRVECQRHDHLRIRVLRRKRVARIDVGTPETAHYYIPDHLGSAGLRSGAQPYRSLRKRRNSLRCVAFAGQWHLKSMCDQMSRSFVRPKESE